MAPSSILKIKHKILNIAGKIDWRFPKSRIVALLSHPLFVALLLFCQLLASVLLYHPLTRIYKPVIHLKNTQPALPSKFLFLCVWGVRILEILHQPHHQLLGRLGRNLRVFTRHAHIFFSLWVVESFNFSFEVSFREQEFVSELPEVFIEVEFELLQLV